MSVAHRNYRHFTKSAAVLALLALSSLADPAAAVDSYSEDSIKAAYLYRFSGYIAWPDGAALNEPFVIDVVGAPGVARELRRLSPAHFPNRRVTEVREVSGVRDLGHAQIVYAGAGHSTFLRSLNPSPQLPAMLLVSDEEGGLNSGSVLNFLTIDRNVRFEVSLTAADRWGLKISSELLGVALRVLGGGRQSNLRCRRLDSAPNDRRCALRAAAQRRSPAVAQLGMHR
jgi:hypothetical protein